MGQGQSVEGGPEDTHLDEAAVSSAAPQKGCFHVLKVECTRTKNGVRHVMRNFTAKNLHSMRTNLGESRVCFALGTVTPYLAETYSHMLRLRRGRRRPGSSSPSSTTLSALAGGEWCVSGKRVIRVHSCILVEHARISMACNVTPFADTQERLGIGKVCRIKSVLNGVTILTPAHSPQDKPSNDLILALDAHIGQPVVLNIFRAHQQRVVGMCGCTAQCPCP